MSILLKLFMPLLKRERRRISDIEDPKDINRKELIFWHDMVMIESIEKPRLLGVMVATSNMLESD